jgi:HSP20 family protein
MLHWLANPLQNALYFDELQEEINKIFYPQSSCSETQVKSTYPPLNVQERETGFEISVFAPGMTKEGFSLQIKGNQLNLSGERPKPATNENEKVYRQERFFGKWSRTLTLPQSADLDSISATYKNGVLGIHLKKRPEEQIKEIPIQEK